MLNPIEHYWNTISQKLKDDNELHKNDVFYRSPYKPELLVQGYFVNGKLRINLSDLYSLLIQKTGQLCQHYAGDLIHSIKHLENVIFNNSPQDAVTYDCIGIRTNGVDGLGYFISRTQDMSPQQLADYYHLVYFLRITRSHTNEQTQYADDVIIEIRALTKHDITSIVKRCIEQNYTFHEFCQVTTKSKIQDTFDHLSLAQQQYQAYYETCQKINDNISDLHHMIHNKNSAPKHYLHLIDIQNATQLLQEEQKASLQKEIEAFKSKK